MFCSLSPQITYSTLQLFRVRRYHFGFVDVGLSVIANEIFAADIDIAHLL